MRKRDVITKVLIRQSVFWTIILLTDILLHGMFSVCGYNLRDRMIMVGTINIITANCFLSWKFYER